LAVASPDSIAIAIDILSEFDYKVSYRIMTAGIDTTIIDYAQAQRDSFLFIGNQVAPAVPQKVLVEVITGIWCSNCHYAEEALKQLKQEYGDDFYYIEYHWNDDLDVGAIEVIEYYNMSYSAPQSMFQGQVKVTGGGGDTYDQYHNTITTFFDQDALVELKHFSYTMSDTLFGQVTIRKDDSLPMEELYIKYALVEKVSSVINPYTGRPCEQVVIAKGMKNIGEEDFSNPISFKLGMPSTVPDDIVLYVWLQTLEDPYNADTCKIYNVIEEDILLGKWSN
ncbi:MAG: thioredoxin family protein, partial [Candidatus Celaenobacter antarcticus]|nr:thioredoxin family protein [Candidatus Celaenobacter antarcticus]